jgi:Cu/Ag efflux protein CusF
MTTARFTALILALAAMLIPACGHKDDTPKTPDATYTVRGEVDSLPVAGDKTTEFRVHHEAIDNFKNEQGKVVGMNSMTMDFPPAKGVDLSNLKKGDKVEMVFSVWWKATPPWMATKVTKLPDDTKLVFGKAHPPK